MKKINLRNLTFAIVLSCCAGIASAQTSQAVTYGTFSETDLSAYNGKTCNVSFFRYVFAGWNSFCVPFDLSAEQVSTLFGANARVEKLVSCTRNGNDVSLNFRNCTTDGVQANEAYLLYTPTAEYVSSLLKGVTVNQQEPAKTTLTDNQGNVVTFAGTYKFLKGAGFYGIPAKVNIDGEVESNLVNTATYNGFYPTRCYVKWNGDAAAKLVINHLGNSDATTTSISDIVSNGAAVDVYNLAGQRVCSHVTANEAAKKLRSGIYVVNGIKVLIK